MDTNEHGTEQQPPLTISTRLRITMMRPWLAFRKLPKRIMLLVVCAYIVISSGITGLLWYSMRDSETGLVNFQRMYTAAAAGFTDSALPESTTDRYLFYWKNDKGELLRSAVNSASYQNFATTQKELIVAKRNASLLATDERIRTELRPILTNIELRVTAYGDWMYNWWTAWIQLAQAFGWAWESLMDGEILKLPDAVQAKLGIEIRKKYNSTVLQPELLEPQMHAILDRSIAVVQREILQSCSQQDDTLRKFIQNQTQQIERYETVAGWVAVLPGSVDITQNRVASICASSGQGSGERLLDGLLVDNPMGDLDAGVNDVILRLSRPFATKLVSFMVLPIVATAVAGGITLPFIGVAGGVLAGVLAGGATSALVIGFSSSAAVDWLLTRADEALSRDDFESHLRRAVNVSAARFEERVAVTLKNYVDGQYNLVAATVLGLKP